MPQPTTRWCFRTAGWFGGNFHGAGVAAAFDYAAVALTLASMRTRSARW